MLNFDYHWLDVSMLVYQYLFSDKKLKRIKLTDTCEFLGIPRGKAHTAMADTKATLEVYRVLRNKK